MPCALPLALALSAASTATGVAVAEEEEKEPTAKPDVLDPKQRPLRGNQLGIDGFGGSFSGRSIGHSFIAGGRVSYYPIRQIGIAAAYGYSLGIGGVSSAHYRPVHIVHGQLELPLMSALRLGKHHPLVMDLFGQGGAGGIYIARSWEPLGVIGGGVRIYPRLRWLSIRVDVLTMLHDTRRASGEDRFDTDVAFTLGLSFLLPPRPPG